jgi:4-amino-4-deoxy-L-arabinose transferase-like glycosyltransferase
MKSESTKRGSRDHLILSLCALMFLALIFPLRGSITDDTFIHMQYARNLAEAGELSFNRGEPTYGATSPLWVFLLALVYKLGGDMAVWSRILSQFFGFASILLIYRYVKTIDGRAFVAGSAAAVMSAEAWLVRWSTVGMETSFSVFMTIAVLIASLHVLRSQSRSALFGLVLFAAYLARPESLLLVPLALVSFAIFKGGEKSSSRFTWLAVFSVLLTIWMIAIHEHTGTFFPLTAGAKQGHLGFSFEMLKKVIVPIKILGATVGIPLVIIIVSMAGWVRGRRDLFTPSCRTMEPGVFLALAWIFALPAVYVIMDFHVLSRYMLPVSPAAISLGMICFYRFAMGSVLSRGRARSAAIILTAIILAQNILFYSIVVVRPTREFSTGLKTVITGIGVYLAENSSEGDVIAAPDIGAVGYYSGRRILDLGGLVSPEINRMRADIDVERIIDEGLYLDLGADYLMDRSIEPMRFSGKVIRGHLFTPVMSGKVENLGIRMQRPVTYVLYRIENTEDGEVGR